MFNSNGKIVPLGVRDHIPYVTLGENHGSADFIDIDKEIIERINRMLSGESGDLEPYGPRSTMYLDADSGDEMAPIDSMNEVKNGKKKRRGKKRQKTKPCVPSEDGDDFYDQDPSGIDTDWPEVVFPDDDAGDGGPPGDPPGDDDDYEPESPIDTPDEPIVEGEDDMIDVDDEAGDSRLSRRGTWRNEARSIEHLLTHKYKNPYCKSCVRAKMKHYQTHRGAFKRKLEKFGDLITFDFVDTRKVKDSGLLELEKDILMIRDRFTGLVKAHVCLRKTTDNVVAGVKTFMGRRNIREAYSDRAPQFQEAMRKLKIPYDMSLPYRPLTNSLAERTNQFVITSTATCLLEAGLPPCFWRPAVECVSNLLNFEPGDDGESPWYKLHQSEFPGLKIPFGAKVSFKPIALRTDQDDKFAPDSIIGVFAGYEIGPGFHWGRRYRVWSLEDMVQQNLCYDAERPNRKLLTPHPTEKVVLEEPLVFPCEEEYEKMNSTLEGMKEKERRGQSPDVRIEDEDEHDDDDDDGGGDHRPPGDEAKHMIKEDKSSSKPPGEHHHAPKSDVPPYYGDGKPGDGVVYVDDDGARVKIAKNGRLYKVGDDDRRLLPHSSRPREDFSVEEWKKLSIKDRERAISLSALKKEEADAEKAKKKKAEEKKKKKEEKSGAGSSKDKKKKAAVGYRCEGHQQDDEVCQWKVD